MFFMNENLVLDFMAAGTLSWKEKSCTVAPRGMDALTFRLRGSGSVFVGEKEYPLEENDFLFMPGGVGYRAEYTDTEIVYFYFLTAERFTEPEVFTPPSPAFSEPCAWTAPPAGICPSPGINCAQPLHLWEFLRKFPDRQPDPRLP